MFILKGESQNIQDFKAPFATINGKINLLDLNTFIFNKSSSYHHNVAKKYHSGI